MVIGEIKRDEEAQEPERTSGIMRVANVPPEKEKEILSDIKTELFDEQTVSRLEREKTPEEVEIINGILTDMADFIKKYRGTALKITPEHIHVVDRDKLSEGQMQGILGVFGGKYWPDNQLITVHPRSDEGYLKFAKVVTHELIHFYAFQSINFDQKGGQMLSRVEGFSTAVGENKDSESYLNGSEFYFNDIEEALTEELTKRFDKEYFGSIPALAEEIRKRNNLRSRIKDKVAAGEIMGCTEKMEKIGGESVTRWRAEDYSYQEQRKELWDLIKDVWHKNPKQFKSVEDIFSMFAEAHFTGRRLKVARLIEKTYGKGSFRKLGEKTKAE